MRDIVSEIISRVNDERDLLAETVSAGSVTNFEQYQRLVGRREGLKMVLDIINEILTEGDSEQ
jgi:hypothetical protein